ncbi:MAG: RIP metalloprotease RseP [Tissierellia bacterium]|nr:RIP metalloprotease RseP [Tissierellia bacterium]
MQTAIAAIFVFLLVILLHELGHFTVAKLVGIRVNEFSIGMGPKLFQKTKGDTKYTFRLLPIGGYCAMEGEDEKSDDPRSFSNVSPFARISVVAAGAIMNFVLAIIIFSIVSFISGTPSTIVGGFSANSPAANSGIMIEDEIIEINGIKIKSWDMITDAIGNSSPEENIKIVVLRNEERLNFNITPIQENGRTIIGITPKYQSSVSTAIKGGIELTWYFIKLLFDFLAGIFRGNFSADDISGPVGVINAIGEAANTGFIDLLILLGYISINLGIFNLLPIPALDGSRIMFLLVELIRGKPINPEKEGFIHMVGFALLITLILVVTYQDLIRINLLQ